MPLIEPISEEKTPYIDALDRKNSTDINKKMLDINEIVKILEVKYITLKNKYTSSTW